MRCSCNIFSLKIVAAALQAFADPTGQFIKQAKEFRLKVGKHHIPTEQTANTAGALLSYLKLQVPTGSPTL